jgi:DNA (cytosine-5)-methyltransferase 1
MKKLNVLSLFDGMSCLQMALEKNNVEVENYFASEIDKHAIKCTKHVFPNTQHIGSVVDVDVASLPKIDLIAGGSPCQSFSFSGKMKGMVTKDEVEILTLEHYLELKNKNYEFEGQSYLFWEYMRILRDIQKYNPDVVFLLENVVMTEKWEKVLTRAIGVKPIMINSALLSAQNRKRLYWTNLCQKPMGLFGDLEQTMPQPKDKGVLLRDVLEGDVSEKYYLSDKMLKYFSSRAANFNQGKVNIRKEEGKASCLTSSMASCDISDNFVCIDTNGRIDKEKTGTLSAAYASGPDNYSSRPFILNTNLRKAVNQNKANCFTAGGNSGGLHSDMTLILASRGRGENWQQELEPRTDGKTNTLTSVQKDNLVIQLNPSKESNGKQPYQQNRVYDINGINPALSTIWCGSNLINTPQIRRLTPRESGRLQTIPEKYIDKMIESGTSDTQLYRMYGNGWTVDVIAYILSFMKKS